MRKVGYRLGEKYVKGILARGICKAVFMWMLLEITINSMLIVPLNHNRKQKTKKKKRKEVAYGREETVWFLKINLNFIKIEA